MRAVRTGGGGQDLSIEDHPCPEPLDHEVLIAVHAAGLNRVDYLQILGKYQPPEGTALSPFLGIEVAGRVAKCGKAVQGYLEGDRVMALCASGGFADFVATPAAHVLKIPPEFSYEQAAAVPEAAATIWYNVFYQAQAQRTETILLHGGSGGVGSFGISFCRAMGLHVFATAGTDEKVKACEKLGAVAVNYKDVDWFQRIGQASGGFDIILDVAGGVTTKENLSLLKRGGRLQQIGYMAGPLSTLDWREVLAKELRIQGSRLRFIPENIKTALFESLRAHMLPHLVSGGLFPTVHKVYPVEKVREALEELALGTHFGKIVLSFNA